MLTQKEALTFIFANYPERKGVIDSKLTEALGSWLRKFELIGFITCGVNGNSKPTFKVTDFATNVYENIVEPQHQKLTLSQRLGNLYLRKFANL